MYFFLSQTSQSNNVHFSEQHMCDICVLFESEDQSDLQILNGTWPRLCLTCTYNNYFFIPNINREDKENVNGGYWKMRCSKQNTVSQMCN